jgi:hypothetical protein
MIHAGFSELRKAFFVHSNAKIEENSISRHLLLFYTVESGLKAVYLKTNNFTNTNKVTDSQIVSTHDLFLLAKILKLPAHITGKQNNFKLKRDGGQHPIKDVHQAWRYHIDIEIDDEKKIVKWLQNLKGWLREKL